MEGHRKMSWGMGNLNCDKCRQQIRNLFGFVKKKRQEEVVQVKMGI